MKIKRTKYFFLVLGSPTRFDLAPTYLHQGWRIRVT